MTCLGNAHSIILHLLITLCSCAVMSSAYGQTDPSVVSEMATAAYPDDMYIDLVVPSHRLYLGEVIRIEYDVYVAKSRGIVHYDNQEPDFESWFIYEDSVPEPSIEIIQDKTYTKEPYAAFFVAPLKAGHLLLPTLAVTIPYKQPSTWITHAAHTVEVLPPPNPIQKTLISTTLVGFSSVPTYRKNGLWKSAKRFHTRTRSHRIHRRKTSNSHLLPPKSRKHQCASIRLNKGTIQNQARTANFIRKRNTWQWLPQDLPEHFPYHLHALFSSIQKPSTMTRFPSLALISSPRHPILARNHRR